MCQFVILAFFRWSIYIQVTHNQKKKKQPMEIIENFGIISSISWNSNGWKDDPTEKDLKKSNYGFVKENAHAHEALNFGHEIYPAEEEDYYIAYTPIFNRLPNAEKSRNVSIVFFISTDYENKKMIVGCYGYPIIGGVNRQAEHEKFNEYDFGNVSSHIGDIIYFDNYVEINNDLAKELSLLPDGKKISQQGFNYLNSDNVLNILSLAFQKNSENKAFNDLIENLKIDTGFTKEINELVDARAVIKTTAGNSLKNIRALEKRMKRATPEIKERISRYIERGEIAKQIKKVTNYKCLVCEQLGENPHSFKKKNGDFYIETHHVEQVSKLKKGSLSATNLITVCANHHRQLHYGNSELLNDDDQKFVFSIEGEEIEIEKIKIE